MDNGWVNHLSSGCIYQTPGFAFDGVFLFANGKFHWWLHRTFEAATCGHRLGWIGHKLADQQKKGSPINYLGYFHIPADFHTIQWMFFFCLNLLEFTQFNSQQFSWGNVFSILLGWKFCVLNYETTQWPNLQVLLAVRLTSVIYVSIDFRGILMDMT